MTEQELKRISKKELIKMVLELSAKEAELTKEKEQLTARLKDKTIIKENAGSIAEASLQLNDLFANAQKAADQYLENIKTMEAVSKAQCDKLQADTKAESERLLTEARNQSEAMIASARYQSDDMVNTAKARSQSYWTVLQNKLESFYDAHRGLKELLEIPAVMVGEVEDKKKSISSILEEKAAESTKRLFASMDRLDNTETAKVKPVKEIAAETETVNAMTDKDNEIVEDALSDPDEIFAAK